MALAEEQLRARREEQERCNPVGSARYGPVGVSSGVGVGEESQAWCSLLTSASCLCPFFQIHKDLYTRPQGARPACHPSPYTSALWPLAMDISALYIALRWLCWPDPYAAEIRISFYCLYKHCCSWTFLVAVVLVSTEWVLFSSKGGTLVEVGHHDSCYRWVT